MEMILLQMLMIAAPIVFIVDFGGVVEKLKKWFFYRIYNKETEYESFDLKPFDCSACLTVWVYWLVFFGMAIYNQQLDWNLIYIFTEGLTAGMMAILIRNKILF